MRTTIVVYLGVMMLAVMLAPTYAADYGPCCPLVKGREAISVRTSAAGTTAMGPRYSCRTHETNLTFDGSSHKINAVRAAGALLIPARIFALTGAKVDWAGGRNLSVSLGNRKVDLMLGSYAAKISDGGDMTTTSWPLCPRIIHGVTYVPVRPLAQALGLGVGWGRGGLSLMPGAEPTTVSAEQIVCPADNAERTLGVTVMRSPADSKYGVGVGIEQVQSGGEAEKLGLRARDVILTWNGNRITCPRDLEQRMGSGRTQSVTVSRGGRKVMLPMR